MKPSERLTEIYTAKADRVGSHVDAALLTQHALSLYLDEEAERRAVFEKDVLERIGALEAIAKPLRYVIAPKDISQAERAKLVQEVSKLGATVLPYGASVPVGVYEGDGHPAARAAYEPDPEGAEET